MSSWNPVRQPPISWVPATPATSTHPDASRVAVLALHDGDHVPQRILDAPRLERVLEDGSLARSFAIKRDWGAGLVAAQLASALSSGGSHRVNVARLVADFNRFPGSTPRHATHLQKLAVSGYLARDLDHTDKRWILESLYDGV